MTARGMSGDRWRELRHVHPTDRVYTRMPPSARRRRGEAPHTRLGPARDSVGLARGHRPDRPVKPNGSVKLWHTTQPRPWDLKDRRRTRGRAARASRKANRS